MSATESTPLSDTAIHASALRLAIIAHRDQTRRDGETPYTSHLRETVARLDDSSEIEIVATAWLHDICEDTPTTIADLAAAGMPESVCAAVHAITKREGEDYLDYLARVRANPIARKVKIADMLANLSDSPTPRQIRRYAEGLLYLTDPQ